MIEKSVSLNPLDLSEDLELRPVALSSIVRRPPSVLPGARQGQTVPSRTTAPAIGPGIPG
jgi:hypothetical protein